MFNAATYTRDVQRFATSHYLSTGVRITVGVMLPTLVLAYFDMLTAGIGFVWGALFVSLPDQPGPIHHRRNGLLTSTFLNAFTLLLTVLCHQLPALLWVEIGVLGFFYSLLSIYGNRAGSIGVLALVVMVVNLSPDKAGSNPYLTSALMMAGGLWYTALSLLAYRVRPYLLVQQAMGEYFIALGDYVKAKAAFYNSDRVDEDHFNKLMEEQVDVHQVQQQVRELLFKTREFITDSAPKGRSLMLMFIESVDLYEQTMSSYEDYKRLHRKLGSTGIMNEMHDVILALGERLEEIGLAVQAGKEAPDNTSISILIANLRKHRMALSTATSNHELSGALEKIVDNIQSIADRVRRLAIYSHFESTKPLPGSREASLSKFVAQQPITFSLLLENLTLQSNTFRHAVRLSITMMIGYGVALILPTSNSYWVVLTILTILKPAYSLTRQRNQDRVLGTLLGAAASFVTLFLIHSNVALLIIMIFCMVMAYSLLRLNYLGFVFFLTIYIIIIFHFLNPIDFSQVILARLIDTVVGSVLAAIAARFILPTWEYKQVTEYMLSMMKALNDYYSEATKMLLGENVTWEEYRLARKACNVALANLSDAFQRMLSENETSRRAKLVHQFVVSSHTLSGYIAALVSSKEENLSIAWIQSIKSETETQLNMAFVPEQESLSATSRDQPAGFLAGQLNYIHSLARDTRKIMNVVDKEPATG